MVFRANNVEQDNPRTILLCVAGLTPQIITETLYALTQERGERIDEIRVITTLGGRDKIMTGKVNGRGRSEESLLHPDCGQFFNFCRDYSIPPETIKFSESSIALLRTPDGRTLTDIRSPIENEYAGDQICEIVRELCLDLNTRIHASAAGGRKTMSIYLTAAMQLFGRARQDTLSHVLVSEQFETHPEFFYIPPVPRNLKTRDGAEVSTALAQIHLAEIPFIRLRGARSEWLRTVSSRYVQIVKDAQEYLDLADAVHDLQLDSRAWTIRVENRNVKLSRMQYIIYALFAYLRQQQKKGLNGFVLINELSRQDFVDVFHYVTAARGKAQPLESAAGFDFLDKLASQAASEHPIDREDLTNSIVNVNSKIARKFKSQELPERYNITTQGDRKPFRYGLNVDPSRIVFLER